MIKPDLAMLALHLLGYPDWYEVTRVPSYTF